MVRIYVISTAPTVLQFEMLVSKFSILVSLQVHLRATLVDQAGFPSFLLSRPPRTLTAASQVSISTSRIPDQAYTGSKYVSESGH